MTTLELVNHLRLLSGYHLGTDLAERLQHADQTQRQQREALAQAADEIERLTDELARVRTVCKGGIETAYDKATSHTLEPSHDV